MVLLRVFYGGSASVQSIPFLAAAGEITTLSESDLYVETVDICQLKDRNWSAVDLVDWLLGSDVHFVLSHVHQGKSNEGTNQMGWDVHRLEEELWRLSDHKGFPTGKNLKCPVFLQDKIRYIRAVPQYTNPTLRVILNKRGQFESSRATIALFMAKTNYEKGWVVKMPYTTNCEYIKICRDLVEVIDALRAACSIYFGRIEYAMLQPCMRNRREYKVVMFNKQPQYIAGISQNPASARAFIGPKDGSKYWIFKFAENAVRELEKCCPEAITDGLLRVDIFQNVENKLVVNEFESLEANISCKNINKQLQTVDHMRQYWFRKINECISSL